MLVNSWKLNSIETDKISASPLILEFLVALDFKKKGTYSFKHFDFLQLQRLQASLSPSNLRLEIQFKIIT